MKVNVKNIKLIKYQKGGPKKPPAYSWSGESQITKPVPAASIPQAPKTNVLVDNDSIENQRARKILQFKPVPSSDTDLDANAKWLENLSADERSTLERSNYSQRLTKGLRAQNILQSEAIKKANKDRNIFHADYAGETQAMGDKMRTSLEDNAFDDYLNFPSMLGHMGSALGQVNKNIQAGNYGQAALAVAMPLGVGAVAGIGAKTTGQFVNNLANPFPVNPFTKPKPTVGIEAWQTPVNNGTIDLRRSSSQLQAPPEQIYISLDDLADSPIPGNRSLQFESLGNSIKPFNKLKEVYEQAGNTVKVLGNELDEKLGKLFSKPKSVEDLQAVVEDANKLLEKGFGIKKIKNSLKLELDNRHNNVVNLLVDEGNGVFKKHGYYSLDKIQPESTKFSDLFKAPSKVGYQKNMDYPHSYTESLKGTGIGAESMQAINNALKFKGNSLYSSTAHTNEGASRYLHDYLNNRVSIKDNPDFIIDDFMKTANQIKKDLGPNPNKSDIYYYLRQAPKSHLNNINTVTYKYLKDGGHNVMQNGKPMYKRKDGQVVKRGLWSKDEWEIIE